MQLFGLLILLSTFNAVGFGECPAPKDSSLFATSCLNWEPEFLKGSLPKAKLRLTEVTKRSSKIYMQSC